MSNKFTVVKPWEHNGHQYQVGDDVDLADDRSGLLPEQIEYLVRQGTVLPPAGAKAGAKTA